MEFTAPRASALPRAFTGSAKNYRFHGYGLFELAFDGFIEKGNENVFHSLTSTMETAATVPQNRNSI